MNEIIINGFDAPTLSTSFEQARAKAIAAANKITVVTSLPLEEMAVEALAELTRLEKGIIDEHKDVKNPFLRMCQSLDGIKNFAIDPMIEPKRQLKKALGDYAELKKQEALALERARQEEVRKAQEAQRIAEEAAASAARALVEAQAEAERFVQLAAASKNRADKIAAEKAALEARIKADEEAFKLAASSKEAQAKEDSIRTSAPVIASKAKGAITKFKLNYRVVDMKKLYAAHPEAVELTEKRSVLTVLVNGRALLKPDEIPKVDGLEIWNEADVSTRSKSYAQA